ncbi:MAG: hypothetical protein HGA19_03495 [Oscillochloris sp.]|nr:hypothetical protein [Oscillochloris sp.]
MDDAQLFMTAARQVGFGAEAALVALAWARERLGQDGVLPVRLYIFRSARQGGVSTESETLPTRPRVLLAFRSADAALGFAQIVGLGKAPQLAAMSLSQLLAALVQRPAIGALHLASEDDSAIHAGLPVGIRIERSALLDQLQIADCRL